MNWTNVLEHIGWPTETLVLDFETFYDVGYRMGRSKDSVSIVEYVTDPRFGFTGLGVEILNHPKAAGPQFIPGPHVEWAIKRLQKLFGKALHNCTVVAKNCKFDILILVEKFGIYPAYIIDIEDLTRFWDSRISQKLKDILPYFGLGYKGDTSQFKGLYYEDMSEQVLQALFEYTIGDIKGETALLKLLLPIISNPGFELRLAMHTLNMYLKPVFTLDYSQASDIIRKMGEEMARDLGATGYTHEEISGTLSFTEILQEALPEEETIPVKKGKPGKNMIKLLGKPGVIPALAKTDLGFVNLSNHADEKVRNLMKAKEAIKSWPNWIKRVKSMVAQSRASGNRLRIPIKYYGGHTGRWSGMEKINVQNFGGRGRGKAVHPLIAQVRNLLLAPDGYKLTICDSAQIEARLLAWLAYQLDLMEGFANDEDIYSDFASTLFMAKVWKPTDEEKKTSEGKTANIRRGFGKDAILGCGYGMGTITFYERCRENDFLRPLFDSGEYDWDFIDKLIKTYRKTYKEIPAFWNKIEKAFRFVCRYPGKMMGYDNGEIFLIKDICYDRAKLFLWKEGSTVHIRLPSGRELLYHKTRVSKTGDISYAHGKLWGGTLTENIIQAIARDLLGYWILECEKVGLPIILHCHDEIVSYSFNGNETQDLNRMNEIVSKGPDWASDIPLAAEGQVAEFYVK